MSVFTPVTPEQLAGWLDRYSVGRLVGLRGIAEGVENTNYFVDTSGGRYVLTLFERLARADLPFYVHLMAHLARHGIPCPAPIADRDNEFLGTLNGRPAILVTRLPGRSVEHPAAERCAAIGAMLADMHLAGQSYGRRLDNPRGPRWRREAAARVAPWLGAEEAALLGEEMRFQALFRLDDLPRGVIHADLFRDNVLFEQGRVGGLIDFYFAGDDALLFDLAVTCNDWCVGGEGELEAERTRALLRGYHAVRPLTALERGAWPVMLRAAALRFWLSRLLDLHAPRPGEMVLVKDPAWFRGILRLRAARGSDLPWLD
jgi:homoserine kinase type II